MEALDHYSKWNRLESSHMGAFDECIFLEKPQQQARHHCLWIFLYPQELSLKLIQGVRTSTRHLGKRLARRLEEVTVQCYTLSYADERTKASEYVFINKAHVGFATFHECIPLYQRFPGTDSWLKTLLQKQKEHSLGGLRGSGFFDSSASITSFDSPAVKEKTLWKNIKILVL
ncbi:hypothetical protein VNO77_02206 [Canavalia gladiata]|uniref:Uncharacterized protein n=1 Tax=Canavalia gladiata TaxID=3824 RepID=A0AAN9MST4_CANGL